jgi:TolB-like protein
MGEPSPGTLPPSMRPPEDRLDSWKEIAAYLNRDVTTVQRWEKREGMPVHRHQHDRIGSVYAFGSELDAWVQSRRLRLEEVEKEEQKQRNPETPADAEGDHGPRGIPRVGRWLVLGGVLVLALLAVTYLMTRGHAGGATRPKITSLAVLPLKNLSGDATQEYLADGMTEALIGRLSNIHDLRVISRTSAMHFKDTQLSVPEIAKTLRVDAIVEGSVIREGSRIRVTAQLIRGASDEHLWSETYDRDLKDALALESEVAQSIARKVQVTVTGEERERLTAVRSVSPEVYESCLKGVFALNKSGSRVGVEESIGYFEKRSREIRRLRQLTSVWQPRMSNSARFISALPPKRRAQKQ